ncbi:thermonuclease family protein [Azotobacter chroococcum]|uniref:thermonuclease family protein n=1 Tax=Azotobacter chroococcum TaxID=353 RepID=UPI0010AE4D6C|nr:thermonuclease family protein [Azotobacter chroococcum]TKD46000.1 thermonuclease family protein [Azotobacter chroococcum]
MRFKLLVASLLSIPSTFAVADASFCKVVDVSDGANFTCLTDAKTHVKVKLAKVKAPNPKQPYGIDARQVLSDLVLGRRIWLQVLANDQHDRSVGRVYVEGIDVNARMVSLGAAWTCRLHNIDQVLLSLEELAHKARRGLWALPESERLPPWEWNKAAQDQPQEKRDESFTHTPGMLIFQSSSSSISI